VVRVAAERLRHDLFQLFLDVIDGLAGRETSAVADAEDMGVDRECFVAERGVEDDIGGLSADARKGLEFFARVRDLPAVIADQRLRQSDDVLRLGVEQADRLDGFAKGFLAQIDHLLRSLDACEKRAGGDVDAGVGGLGGENDGDEKLIRIAGLELRGRRRIGFGQPAKEFEKLGPVHGEPITSRIE